MGNIQDILNTITKHSAKRILIQAPEGLKKQITGIADELQKTGKDVIIYVDPCYGACDLPIYEAEQIGADLIVHIGHREFHKKVNSNVPVVYVDWNFDIKIDDNIKNEIKKLKEQRIGLICSVQYLDS
ncbi:MAG: diphthamide synthesis protein, partial [Candidatus Aenigmatarchaeota archaeon]